MSKRKVIKIMLLVFAVCILGLSSRRLVILGVDSEVGYSTYYITIELSGRPKGFHQNLEVGVPINEAIMRVPFGIIKDISAEPFLLIAYDWVRTPVFRFPESQMENIRLVVQVEAMKCDYALTTVEGTVIRVNANLWLRSRDFAGGALVISISEGLDYVR